AELLALPGIVQRRFICALRHAKAQSGDADASSVENFHGIDEAMPDLAEEIVFGNAAILENYGRRIAGAQAGFVFLLSWKESGRTFLQNECGNAVPSGCFVGNGHRDTDVAVGAMSGKRFLTV